MERTILFEETFDSNFSLTWNKTSVYENLSNHAFSGTTIDSRIDKLHNDFNSLLGLSEKDYTCDSISHSDEESSLFNSEGVLTGYLCLPSILKLKKFKQAVSEVDTKYLDWIVSELVLSKYKSICFEMPTHTATRIRHIISYSVVESVSVMKNRRGETLTLLGLEESDFATVLKKPLLSSEKEELSNRVLNALKTSIGKLSEEKEKFKGTFGGHCLKVIAADTALSEERMQQAQMNEQLSLQLYQGCEALTSSNQIMHQLAHLEVDSVQQLQKVSHFTLKNKARHLCNQISILRHKMDQISLADVNNTRTLNLAGKSLKTSVDELIEKRKRLLKILEKYERKENASNKFNEIVAEYAKTKRQLHHKLQTLKVLDEADASFS